MLIGVSEGQGWRYEVVERRDDYLVRMRDLDTDSIEEDESRLFRTAAVAFAYADLSACFDRYATARMGGEDVEELGRALAAQQARFEGMSARLRDEGVSAQLAAAWEHEAARTRSRLH